MLLTAAGFLFGRSCATASSGDSAKGPRGRIVVISTTIMCVAGGFWIWAALLSMTRHLDLGIIIFCFALLAGMVARVAALRLAPRMVCCSRVLLPLSCLLVAASYGVLGMYASPVPWTLPVYFWLGVVWWTVAGLSSFVLARGLMREARIRTTSKYEGVTVFGREVDAH